MTTSEEQGAIARLTLLAAALAALMLCACGAQKRLRSGACEEHHQGAALLTRHVIVFAVRAARAATTTYYACLRPAGGALRIGISELGSIYGSDATTGGFTAAGTYVAAQSSSGEATLAVCARYSNIRRCTPALHWLTVIDARNHRQTHIPIYTSLPLPALVPLPLTLLLSPTGEVAWLENSTVGATVTGSVQIWATGLTPSGRSGLAAVPTMIEAGSINPSSVRFQARVLYWVRDHEQHRRTLH
jgi:hypothetical protein